MWFGCISIAAEPISVQEQPGRLILTQGSVMVGEFIFKHPTMLRPGFANLRAPGGIPVTRNFPPIEGVDAIDHADLHPGIWLGFGDLAGEDFWRNKGTIRHERFIEKATWSNGSLTFATLNTILTSNGASLADMTNRFKLAPQDHAMRIEGHASFTPTINGFYFGDQEEMGLGVRIATVINEKNGGIITSSTGKTTAKATWGQPAAWCDYSGVIAGRHVGIMTVPDPANAHPSWWHNRDYGVFVSNPFGRKAMKQGETSRIHVKRGETYRLKHTVIIHASPDAKAPDLHQLLK